MELKRLAIGKRRLSRRQQRYWDVFEFLIRLIVLSVPLYLIIGFGISLYPMQLAAAGQSAWILESAGYTVRQDGAYLAVGGGEPANDFHFYVNEDCTAWKSILFLFALVMAVPGIAWLRRGMGLLVGFPAIWLGNLARVVGVVLAERSYGVETAMIIHDYLWQFGLMALVLLIWAGWLFYARRK